MLAFFELSNLNGMNGFIIRGEHNGDNSGFSVSGAGDFNDDGLNDLLIGAPFADPNGSRSGEAYVLFGSNGGFNQFFDLAAVDGLNGRKFFGIDQSDWAGSLVSSAGDLNNDGIDDIAIGSANSVPSGEYYIVFGSASETAANTNLGTLNGANGFVLTGDSFGTSANSAGDLNGDGTDDLIVSSPNKSYVIFGSSSGFGPSLGISSLDGTNGFSISAAGVPQATGSQGRSVQNAGDINNDGIDDIIIGVPNASPGGMQSAGAAYVVFGKLTGFSTDLELTSLNGMDGFSISGLNAGDGLGTSVANAGDINGDGIDDLIVGARGANPGISAGDEGQYYVIFGAIGGLSANFDLHTLDGTNGFAINGINSQSAIGTAISGIGDFNADGIDDILIGAGTATVSGRAYAGQSYVIFGSSSGFAPNLELDTLDGTNGFAINGVVSNERSGESVSFAGDINNDGISDLIVGAPHGGKFFSGASYVIFGGALLNLILPITGTVNADTLIGTSNSEWMDGQDGSDNLFGLGGFDSIRGMLGDDTISGGDGDDFVDAGEGDDSILGDAGNDQLYSGLGNDKVDGGFGDDFVQSSNGRDTLFGGFGSDTLGAGSGSDLIRGADGNDKLFGSNGNDRLFGGNGFDFIVGGNGRDTLIGDSGPDYLDGGAQVDTASYFTADASVVVSLNSGSGTAGDALGDTLRSIENLEGSRFSDTLTGNTSANRIDGGGGSDFIAGLASNDTLIGQGGNDTATGGTGNDQFWFFIGDGADEITDFVAGSATDDVIRIFGRGAALDSFSELMALASQIGSNVFINLGGGDSITLLNVTLGNLDTTDFIFG